MRDVNIALQPDPTRERIGNVNIARGWRRKAIPSVFLVKADGTVLFEKLYGDAIANQLKEIFGY